MLKEIAMNPIAYWVPENSKVEMKNNLIFANGRPIIQILPLVEGQRGHRFSLSVIDQDCDKYLADMVARPCTFDDNSFIHTDKCIVALHDIT